MKSSRYPPVALSIAGSDSGGGAGIQADLKTFTALGVFGTTAITCLTAQNPAEVRGIQAVRPSMVSLQIETVLDGFPVAAAKTGMLYNAAIIGAVAETLARRRVRRLIVDPVMVATSGARLLRPDAVRALCRRLLPLASVLTPNLPEAETLWGRPIRGLAEARAAAEALGRRFGTACVVKGGHLPGPTVADVLFCAGHTHVYHAARIHAATHGTGCMFSAALAALLARGLNVPDAVRMAKRHVHACLARSRAPADPVRPERCTPP